MKKNYIKNIGRFLIISYELSDGQSKSEKGTFTDGKDANGNDIKVLSVTGSYSWTAPDGSEFQVFYIADEVSYVVHLNFFKIFLHE